MRSELRILFLAIALLTACTVTIFTWVITYLLDEASREITNNLEHAHIVQRAEQYLVDLNNEATQLARSFELSRSLSDTDLKKISTSFTAFMTSYEVGGDFTHALLTADGMHPAETALLV